MALLEINNLCHSYDDKVLYKNASLEIFKGGIALWKKRKLIIKG